MGRYIAKSDIENIFGVANVAKWSNLDNNECSGTPNNTRITQAIAIAEDYFDDRMRRSVYTIPIGTAPRTVIDIVAKLAGVWLYEARGITDDEEDNPITAHKQFAERAINRILRGELNLSSALENGTPTSPQVV